MGSEPGCLRAVLFDLDGTLVDSLADIAGSMNHTLARFGLPTHPEARYRVMVGEGLEVLARRAIPEERWGLLEEVLAEYRAHYAVHALDASRPYPGIAELLDGLAERHVPIAVLSNKRDDFTRAMVSALLGRWSFVQVLGERVGIPRKPDPSAALEIASALGVEPAACGFVGDTAIDMRTAVAAGMFPVGALWGFRGREELVAAGARLLLSHPPELLGRVG